MIELDAWLEDKLVGQFSQDSNGIVTFAYDGDAPLTPISLSLPRAGRAARRAPGTFLENLLPDNKQARARMAKVYEADSDSTFDLLAKGGGDIAGGLVLVPSGDSPIVDVPELNPALDRDISERIAAIKRDPDSWAPEDRPARFSLAGTQGKFALAKVEGDWYWSNASVPSTHIIKPARSKLEGLEEAEAAALGLAAAVGLEAPHASVLVAGDQSAFIIERFDRARGVSFATRLHAEDFAQAAGLPPNGKYKMTASQALTLIKPVDPNGVLAREFIRQLAFNTFIGHADAHAKNYSLLLRPDSVALSPMYDVVPVGLYPDFNQDLAMAISGAHRPEAVQAAHWRKLGRSNGLDPDEVLALVSEISDRISEHVDTAWDSLEHQKGLLARELVLRNIQNLTSKDVPTSDLNNPESGGGSKRRARRKDLYVSRNGGEITKKRK